MAVTVTASSTTGRVLDNEELEKVTRMANEILELESKKQKLMNFIEGNRNLIVKEECCQLHRIYQQ